MNRWLKVTKFDAGAAALADRHYSRRKVGSPQFMPPGQTLVLRTACERAVFGWWRPDPESGIRAMNGLDGWTCTIFRNESGELSSELILAAECALLERYACGPDGLITYVWDRKVRSTNPGYCFKCAGWRVTGRSADGRKTLLQKRSSLPAPTEKNVFSVQRAKAKQVATDRMPVKRRMLPDVNGQPLRCLRCE